MKFSPPVPSAPCRGPGNPRTRTAPSRKASTRSEVRMFFLGSESMAHLFHIPKSVPFLKSRPKISKWLELGAYHFWTKPQFYCCIMLLYPILSIKFPWSDSHLFFVCKTHHFWTHFGFNISQSRQGDCAFVGIYGDQVSFGGWALILGLSMFN